MRRLGLNSKEVDEYLDETLRQLLLEVGKSALSDPIPPPVPSEPRPGTSFDDYRAATRAAEKRWRQGFTQTGDLKADIHELLVALDKMPSTHWLTGGSVR